MDLKERTLIFVGGEIYHSPFLELRWETSRAGPLTSTLPSKLPPSDPIFEREGKETLIFRLVILDRPSTLPCPLLPYSTHAHSGSWQVWVLKLYLDVKPNHLEIKDPKLP